MSDRTLKTQKTNTYDLMSSGQHSKLADKLEPFYISFDNDASTTAYISNGIPRCDQTASEPDDEITVEVIKKLDAY